MTTKATSAAASATDIGTLPAAPKALATPTTQHKETAEEGSQPTVLSQSFVSHHAAPIYYIHNFWDTVVQQQQQELNQQQAALHTFTKPIGSLSADLYHQSNNPAAVVLPIGAPKMAVDNFFVAPTTGFDYSTLSSFMLHQQQQQSASLPQTPTTTILKDDVFLAQPSTFLYRDITTNSLLGVNTSGNNSSSSTSSNSSSSGSSTSSSNSSVTDQPQDDTASLSSLSSSQHSSCDKITLSPCLSPVTSPTNFLYNHEPLFDGGISSDLHQQHNPHSSNDNDRNAFLDSTDDPQDFNEDSLGLLDSDDIEDSQLFDLYQRDQHKPKRQNSLFERHLSNNDDLDWFKLLDAFSADVACDLLTPNSETSAFDDTEEDEEEEEDGLNQEDDPFDDNQAMPTITLFTAEQEEEQEEADDDENEEDYSRDAVEANLSTKKRKRTSGGLSDGTDKDRDNTVAHINNNHRTTINSRQKRRKKGTKSSSSLLSKKKNSEYHHHHHQHLQNHNHHHHQQHTKKQRLLPVHPIHQSNHSTKENDHTDCNYKEIPNHSQLIEKTTHDASSAEANQENNNQKTLFQQLTEADIDWCRYCGTTEGVNWRPGPWGKRTLCNKHGCDYKGYGLASRLPRLDLSAFAHEKLQDRLRPVVQYFCIVCQSPEITDEQTNDLILCEGGCSRAYHQQCHSPPITVNPKVDSVRWYCSAFCKENRKRNKVVVELPRKHMPLMHLLPKVLKKKSSST